MRWRKMSEKQETVYFQCVSQYDFKQSQSSLSKYQSLPEGDFLIVCICCRKVNKAFSSQI